LEAGELNNRSNLSNNNKIKITLMNLEDLVMKIIKIKEDNKISEILEVLNSNLLRKIKFLRTINHNNNRKKRKLTGFRIN